MEPDNDEPICRFCFDGAGEEELISPCDCRGHQEHIHLTCLLEWLRRSESERLRRAPTCGVCQQPFRLRTRGVGAWACHCVRACRPSTCAECVHGGLEHVLQERCNHLHCHALRWLVCGGLLQLCVWQGQLLLATLAYRLIRALLIIDALLDHLLVPDTVLPLVHFALPPLCELRPRALTLGPRHRRAATAPSTSAPPHANGARATADSGGLFGWLQRVLSNTWRGGKRLVLGGGAIRFPTLQAGALWAAARRIASLGGGPHARGAPAVHGRPDAAGEAYAALSSALSLWREKVLALPASAQMRRCEGEDYANARWAAGFGGPGAGWEGVVGLDGRGSGSDWSPVRWRSVASLDADVTLLALCVLWLNLAAISTLVGMQSRRARLELTRTYRRMLYSLQPLELPIVAMEDVAHTLVQLGCAAYCGRVLAERCELIAPHAHPLDFASADGIALHTALGLGSWAGLSALSSVATAMQDGYAEWRWSAEAVSVRKAEPTVRAGASRSVR